MTNRYIIGMFYDAAYLSRQLIARIIEPLAVLELCGQFYAYNKYATLSLQTLVLWDFSVQQALIDCSGYIKRFTNPGKSRFSGVFLYPNGLICFKVKFLKSLKPQNDASSFFDLDSMQKAKICVDHFRGVPCISCGENSFAIFWLTMSKLHSIPTRLKP